MTVGMGFGVVNGRAVVARSHGLRRLTLGVGQLPRGQTRFISGLKLKNAVRVAKAKLPFGCERRPRS